MIVIHEEPEGGFWAEVPALPGCYSQGETMDELMINIREAITGVLEVMKEFGAIPSQTCGFRIWLFSTDLVLGHVPHLRIALRHK
jgi:predicted RNase H-like HicB family nuclease